MGYKANDMYASLAHGSKKVETAVLDPPLVLNEKLEGFN